MAQHFKRFLWMKKKKLCLLIIIGILITYFILCIGFASKYRDYVPVFIVEEHHEALPYWIDVAHEGSMHKTENTLIHIDGHSDAGLPHYVAGYPLFHWPWTAMEVHLMMQQNDVFILAGAIIDLIDRFIWITPSWNNDTKDITHEIINIEIGLAKVVIKGEERILVCKCEMEQDNRNPKKIVKTCVHMNESFEPGDGGDITVELNPASLCEVKKSIMYEVVSIETAIQNVKTGEWLNKDESVILDIDEDYFGCEIPGQRLYDVDMNWDGIQYLDDKMVDVFCPLFIHHENAGRDIMVKLLHKLVEMCRYDRNDYSPHIKCKITVFQFIRNTVSMFIESWKEDPYLYCARNDAKLKIKTTEMVKAFYQLSLAQIYAVLKIGFCFNTSPKTVWFEDDGALVICHGSNDPKKPMVQVYVPENEREVQNSLKVINQFIDVIPQPKAVTICRSIRDGYTPRKYFRTIEGTLVNYFKSKKKQNNKNVYRLSYDENLLNKSFGLS